MIHICNIQCLTMDQEEASLLNIKDKGKWLPFMFKLDIVEAIKLASDEPDALAYEKTSVFTNGGDVYVIDTPFDVFQTIFIKHNIEGHLPDREEPSF
jgi:hypothetical protein